MRPVRSLWMWAPGDLEKAQSEQAARWSGRMADLLEDHPDAEDELAGRWLWSCKRACLEARM